MSHRFAVMDAQNDRQREIVVAMLIQGEAWMAKLNGRKGLWKYMGSEPLFNFGADLVVPQYDADLDELIRGFQSMPYGKTTVAKQLTLISEKVKQLGGHELVWC